MTNSEPAVMTGRVMMNREAAAGIFLISLKLAAAFPTPTPGQFVMIKACDGHDPLLRRPFSIHAFTRGRDHAVLEILYRVVGRGTRLLALLPSDAAVSIMGPLGKGFTLIPARKNIIILAGGMGIAPLSFLIQQYMDVIRRAAGRGGLASRVICYLGAATGDYLVGLKKIEACCDDIRVSTDDGSCGYHGNVIELFHRDLAFYHPDDAAIYACGPAIMLQELDKILAGQGFFCQVSMEERMACGLGACLGCAVASKGRAGPMTYQRVCKDGPVFDIRDVGWQA
ncbi:MAG: dihydroorotate dehydrogenase electron transfer subunit [Deltaproteobacteria bacterium]|nr:dihydroorotate dehydrogenase electron transfer subunit [Deltaproteobacteria bacterium]